MANTNVPYGLLPVTSATGAPSNYEMGNGWVAYNDTNKIFRGDPIKKLASGFMGAWTAGTAVSQLAGIFWGCEYLSVSQGKKVFSQFWPGADVASTAQSSIQISYIPCNLAIPGTFRAQSDATGVAFADIGQTIDLNMGTGTAINGQSGAYLDVTTMGTTATLPFRIVALYGGGLGAGGYGGIQPGTAGPYSGSPTGAYNWVIVAANNSGSTGI